MSEFQPYLEAELRLQHERYRIRRERFRKAAAEAHTDWRLGRAGQPANFSGAASILGAGLGDIARLRLTALFLPIIHTIGRIEHDIDRIIALASNRDPYCPSGSVSPKPPVLGTTSCDEQTHTPLFLRTGERRT